MELASRDYKAMGRSRFEISGCGLVGCEHALASCLESGGDGSGTCVIHESEYNEMRMRKRRVTDIQTRLNRSNLNTNTRLQRRKREDVNGNIDLSIRARTS